MNAPSDSDESDVDFVPDEKVCTDDEDDSQSDEIDEEAENNGAVNPNAKGKKRSSRNQRKSNNHSKRLRQDETVDIVEKKADPTVEKKHEEDLWASFLNVDKSSSSNSSSLGKNSVADDDSAAHQSQQGNEDGNGQSGDSSSDVLNKSAKSTNPPVRRRPGVGAVGGGLSSILNKIGKNNKLSTLEKSKLDWNSFKKDEGIEEEISVYNRGREGYLERQDFLQRTDVRQFEIEKDLRTTKRSNR
ncbi:yeti isoform X2 [Arctopsyche grandis]